jgi:pectate lyase
MKKTLLTLLAAFFALVAGAQTIDTDKLSVYDKNAPFGWGTGITGGDGENVVTVETYNDLINAIQPSAFNTTKKTIYVKGTIEFSGFKEFRGIKNKTIIGLPGAVLTNPTHSADKNKTGIFYMRECDNIIIRNLTFKSAGAYDIDGNDNISLIGCTNIWIDHCDFQDGVDGNLDATNASDNICVTWCRFRYLIEPWSGGTGGSNDHRFTNLWGNSDSQTGDQGKLRTTFANCWWDEGCKARMPRCRNALIEMISCYWGVSRCQYHIGPENSVCLLRNCEFNGKERVSRFGGYIFVKSDETILYESRPEEITEDMKQFHNEYDDIEKEKVIEVITDEENGSGNTLKIEL